MITRLKNFFQSHQQTQSPEEQAKYLNIAAASLLLEVVYADQTLSDEEAALLPDLLTSTLSLGITEANALIDEAKKVQGDATSLYQFTKEINERCSLEQKQTLVLAMWKLAYADGKLYRYEDQIIRRTADLLYLKHSELIQIRNKAMQQQR